MCYFKSTQKEGFKQKNTVNDQQKSASNKDHKTIMFQTKEYSKMS